MKNIKAKDLRLGLHGAFENLESNKEYVNGLNVFPVPDGDTGTNMSLTLKSVINKLQDTEDTIVSISKALSTGSLMGARGNSGVILSQLCRGIANVFAKVETIEIVNLVEALESAKETAYKAVLKPTEGTILTVSRYIAEFARREFLKYGEIDEFLKAIIEEGKRALDKTPDMLPVLKEAGVVDAGGQGLVFILEGFYRALIGEPVKSIIEDKDLKDVNLKDTIHHHSDINPEDIVYGYCTEFLINHDGSKSHEDFKEQILSYGDSIVCVGDENLIKTHIHTDDPGQVLSLARKMGELSDIKIENMRFQNAEVNKKRESQQAKEFNIKEEKNKKYGFVTITIGEGFDEIFSEMNVDRLIKGGQTMNPSTEDIVKAVEEVNADNVFVFPNNKNIILAAKQAVELVDKNLVVIETQSIPQSFTALINFDEKLDPQENFYNMTNSLDEVTSLQLTYAIRDTKNGELDIKEGDYIGLESGKITVKGNDIEQTFMNLVKKSLKDDHSLLSIYFGEDIKEDEANELAEKLENIYPDLDIEVFFGGQPLYYYIGSLE